ncbi:hypothetical protein HGRIS_008668 [Hohenbuehelia grisea]|uniref:Uncharacterized protein n=1 Tax=Hohenbuehelia grisea TaxID=104357 RepID=A0ABR3J8N7_9AGAR
MSSSSNVNTNASPADIVRPASPISLSAIGLKDHRAFDLERQRARKGTDHQTQLRREQHQSSWARSLSLRFTGTPSSRAKTPRRSLASVVGLSLSLTQSDVYAEQPHDGVRASSPSPPRTPMASSPAADVRPSASSEVQLADLIRVRPQRKGRAPRDGDFEVIPAVKPVIALDDHSAQDYEPAFEEPWEHINTPVSGSEAGEPADQSFQVPSYASVLATGI